MSKGIQIIKENNNLAEWSRQVEECRNSGLSVRSWCERHQIAVSTFHYRQQKVWKALQNSSQFVEVPLSFDESHNNNIAASVKIGSICAEVHNGADEATLAALFRAQMKLHSPHCFAYSNHVKRFQRSKGLPCLRLHGSSPWDRWSGDYH